MNNYNILSTDYNDLKNILVRHRMKNHSYSDYINNDYDLLKDLNKLSDIDKASDIIYKHINLGNNILICSDLDCDGMTSAMSLYLFLKDVFKVKDENVRVIINKRSHGNGFNPILVNRIKELHKEFKIDLMITSDHGSVNENEYQDLKQSCGFEIVVTDHHTVQYDIYPNTADAFVNPLRKDSEYFTEISGCTVAFLVMVYTYHKHIKESNKKDYYHIFPYPAISIISDIMSCELPLNRYIYRIGLNYINRLQNTNFVSYKSILNIPYMFNHNDVKMKLTPFINSVNRTDIEQIGYDLLSSTNYDLSKSLAVIVQEKNDLKKKETKEITKFILDNVNELEKDGGYCCILDSKTTINGVVAARIGDKLKVPVICFSGNDKLAGSCRAVLEGFDLLECLDRINKEDNSIIIKYGGHKSACGCSIYRDKFDLFKKHFYTISKDMMSKLDIDKTINIDCFIPINKITPDLVNIIRSIGPYGKDWEEPIFISKAKFKYSLPLGSIAKLTFYKNDKSTISGFYNIPSNITDIKEYLIRNEEYKIVYNIDITSYNGAYDYSLNIIDIIKDENE